MNRPMIPPDLGWYLNKQARRFAQDIMNRVRRVDVQALAADWPVVGVDISYWQGNVDFSKLAGMVDFAFLRAGFGNDWIDPRLDEYRAGCRACGIPFGLYWFVKAGKDWRKHAQNFYNAWEQDPGDLPPVFDLEDSGGLNKTALESWWSKMYSSFLALSGLQHNDVLTYTSPGFLNRAIGATSWMKRTQLWDAHWTSAAQPILPNEWVDINNPKDWVYWQWSATGKGSDYGVSSHYIDLDRKNITAPPPPPPPPPGEPEMKYRVTPAGAGLRIRSTPEYKSDNSNIVGTRQVGDIVIPLDTIGDKTRYASYWVMDKQGWSAAQWYGKEYMEPFI